MTDDIDPRLVESVRGDAELLAELEAFLQGGQPRREATLEALESGPAAPEMTDVLRRGPAAPGEPQDRDSRPVRGGELEAIVRRFGRPSLLIWGGNYELPSSEVWRDRLADARGALRSAIPSVGRVEVSGVSSYLGTAWMIAPGVAVTNRHVAEVFARQRGGAFGFRTDPFGRPMTARVDFLEEHDNTRSAEVVVEDILYVAEHLPGEPDLAFLRLGGEQLPPVIPLFDGDVTERQRVAVIGYPAADSRNNADDQQRIFDGLFNVKRLAPGEVLAKDASGFFTHDCTTLGGNSGSVVVDLATGRAVGLHFAGREGDANFAVSSSTLLEYLHRFVEVGEGGPPRPASLPDLGIGEEEARSPFSAEELWTRPGFDADFLGEGHAVPLPTPIDPAEVLSVDHPDGSTHRLDYQNFTVFMHEQRRLAMLAAVNIDGEQLVRVKRGRDKWYLDPRIDPDQQLDNSLYIHNPLDRGHLVRRLDPAWGPDEATIERAVLDSFYWTNCSPQHSTLNQQLWLGLEDYLLNSADTRDFRASIFSGPIFTDEDPPYRELTQIPQAFWKVAVMVSTPEDGDEGGDLVATGYVVSQADLIEDLPPEFAFTGYRHYQVPIRRIERLARLQFADAIRAADPMVEEGAAAGRILHEHSDIVLKKMTRTPA